MIQNSISAFLGGTTVKQKLLYLYFCSYFRWDLLFVLLATPMLYFPKYNLQQQKRCSFKMSHCCGIQNMQHALVGMETTGNTSTHRNGVIDWYKGNNY
jgi:hypothetical protein